MRAKCITKTDFEGNAVILNDLSHKPSFCIKKIKNNLQNLIQPKNYNLYIEQDYSSNKILFAVSPLYQRQIHGVVANEEVPVTAKHSRYIYAAKNAIDKYEKALADKEQKEWELKQKQQNIEDLKDIAGTVLFSPLFLVEGILHIINPKWATKFEKLIIDKII